jgi:hypothetical protein
MRCDEENRNWYADPASGSRVQIICNACGFSNSRLCRKCAENLLPTTYFFEHEFQVMQELGAQWDIKVSAPKYIASRAKKK